MCPLYDQLVITLLVHLHHSVFLTLMLQTTLLCQNENTKVVQSGETVEGECWKLFRHICDLFLSYKAFSVILPIKCVVSSVLPST